jgi:hypothetical protein
MSKSLKLLLASAVCWSLLGCWKLPDNFATLPLRKKIEVYERRFKLGGARSYYAEGLIAAHGSAAAEAMAPYITRERVGISPFVAINVVWDVQTRGCNLRGSSSERALEALLKGGHAQEDEKTAAEGALDSILHDRHEVGSTPLTSDVCKPVRDVPAP